MKTFPVGDFKSRFSEVLDLIKKGREIAISYGRSRKKIAVLVPFEKYSRKNPRKLGILENKASFKIRDGFKLSDEELLTS